MRAMILLCIIVLCAGLAEARTVKNDYYGGIIWPYIERVAAMNAKKESLRIEGYCMSACTLYLGVKRLCITEDVKFYFHRPVADKAEWIALGVREINKVYPKWVKDWMREQNVLAAIKDYRIMTADYALKHVPLCP